MTCPRCRTVAPVDAVRCPSCGGELGAGLRGTLAASAPSAGPAVPVVPIVPSSAAPTPPPASARPVDRFRLPPTPAPATPVDDSRPPHVEGLEGLVPVGSGSFSTVFRARQPSLDRVVAVKVMKVKLTDAASRAAFEDECTATGRLSEHPNIVAMYGSGVADDGRPYIVLAHYSGGSLAARASGVRSLDLAEVLRIGVKLSSALHAAHVAGILHCDVKPGNVLMSRYGEPMLGDFGIASLRRDGTTSAMLTPNFASPEVLRGAPPTQSSDTYALAATVFALLTGESPHSRLPGEALEVMGERVRTGPRPRIHHPEVDADSAAVLLAGLHPDPVERVRSALDYGRSLQAIQARLGLGITDLAGAPTTVVAGWRPTTPAPAAGSTPAIAVDAPAAVATSGQRASMGVRAQAAVVDVAASVALTAVGTVASQALPDAPVPSVAGSAAAAAVGLAVYHLLFAGLVGPTLGRWWAGLTLSRRGATGRVPLWVATVRVLIALGAIVPLGAGYWVGLGARRCTWPDEVSGASVVLAPTVEPGRWMAATAGVVAVSSIAIAVGAAFLFGAP